MSQPLSKSGPARRETRRQREARLKREAKALADRRRLWTVTLSDGRRIGVRAEVRSGAACGAMQRDVAVNIFEEKRGECVNDDGSDNEANRQWNVPLYNSCMWPPCGDANRFTWEEGEDVLEIAVDGTSLHVWTGALVLFINGRDADTGQPAEKYWQKQFAKKLVAGLVLMAIGGSFVGVMVATKIMLLSMVVLLIPFGLFHFLVGLFGVLCFFRTPSASTRQAQQDSERRVLLDSDANHGPPPTVRPVLDV